MLTRLEPVVLQVGSASADDPVSSWPAIPKGSEVRLTGKISGGPRWVELCHHLGENVHTLRMEHLGFDSMPSSEEWMAIQHVPLHTLDLRQVTLPNDNTTNPLAEVMKGLQGLHSLMLERDRVFMQTDRVFLMLPPP